MLGIRIMKEIFNINMNFNKNKNLSIIFI